MSPKIWISRWKIRDNFLIGVRQIFNRDLHLKDLNVVNGCAFFKRKKEICKLIVSNTRRQKFRCPRCGDNKAEIAHGFWWMNRPPRVGSHTMSPSQSAICIVITEILRVVYEKLNFRSPTFLTCKFQLLQKLFWVKFNFHLSIIQFYLTSYFFVLQSLKKDIGYVCITTKTQVKEAAKGRKNSRRR